MVSESSGLEAATRRLSAALDGLEEALERRQESDGREATLVAQVAGLAADRSRLADALDRETAKARRLETAGRETTQRIDRAMDAVRSVVDAPDLDAPARDVPVRDVPARDLPAPADPVEMTGDAGGAAKDRPRPPPSQPEGSRR